MAGHLLRRHPSGSDYLIDVAVQWQPARTGTSSDEALATYRRHRSRLADALHPVPAQRPGPGDIAAAPVDAGPEEPSAPGLFASDLLEAATALYDPTLPYHNAGHALRAVANGERLLRACATTGVQVDATVVRFALLFHDAGYGTDPSTAGCPDAEAYAAALARRALADRVAPPVLDDIEAAILATRRGTRPETPEAKVVRAADLADLAADYDTFAAHSEALRVEHERLSGSPMGLPEWRQSVDQLLSGYLEEPLWPLELIDHGPGQAGSEQAGSEQAGYHAIAKANLRRYLVQLD